MRKPIIGTVRSRITSELWYWKTIVMFAKLNILLRIAPPNKETLEKLLESLEELRVKLGVD